MDDPDDEIAAAAAKLAHDSAGGHAVAARAVALQRAALLPPDGAAARGAPRHELGLRPAAAVRAGLARDAEHVSAPAPAASALERALAATPEDLLANDSLAFAPAAADDIAHHVADKRLVALLAWIAQRHGIVVTIIRTGHARYVAGTHKESNHWFGRAATISEVDGEPVSPGSHAAAALWDELQTAPRALRPDEIGAPWSNPANPRWFTGPDEKATLHVGFDAVGAKKA